jgi:hypothetical protein
MSEQEVTRQMTFVLKGSTRDVLVAQIEALCRKWDVRHRLREERGGRSSICMLELRGRPDLLLTAEEKVREALAQEHLLRASHQGLSRLAVSGLSFAGGLIGFGMLFALSSQCG